MAWEWIETIQRRYRTRRRLAYFRARLPATLDNLSATQKAENPALKEIWEPGILTRKDAIEAAYSLTQDALRHNNADEASKWLAIACQLVTQKERTQYHPYDRHNGDENVHCLVESYGTTLSLPFNAQKIARQMAFEGVSPQLVEDVLLSTLLRCGPEARQILYTIYGDWTQGSNRSISPDFFFSATRSLSLQLSDEMASTMATLKKNLQDLAARITAISPEDHVQRRSLEKTRKGFQAELQAMKDNNATLHGHTVAFIQAFGQYEPLCRHLLNGTQPDDKTLCHDPTPFFQFFDHDDLKGFLRPDMISAETLGGDFMLRSYSADRVLYAYQFIAKHPALLEKLGSLPEETRDSIIRCRALQKMIASNGIPEGAWEDVHAVLAAIGRDITEVLKHANPTGKGKGKAAVMATTVEANSTADAMPLPTKAPLPVPAPATAPTFFSPIPTDVNGMMITEYDTLCNLVNYPFSTATREQPTSIFETAGMIGKLLKHPAFGDSTTFSAIAKMHLSDGCTSTLRLITYQPPLSTNGPPPAYHDAAASTVISAVTQLHFPRDTDRRVVLLPKERGSGSDLYDINVYVQTPQGTEPWQCGCITLDARLEKQPDNFRKQACSAIDLNGTSDTITVLEYDKNHCITDIQHIQCDVSQPRLEPTAPPAMMNPIYGVGGIQ